MAVLHSRSLAHYTRCFYFHYLVSQKANERQMDEEIKRHDLQKKQSGVGVESSFSYVRGATHQLEKMPDLSPHWLNPSLQFTPFLPQDNEFLDVEQSMLPSSLPIPVLSFSHLCLSLSLSLFLFSSLLCSLPFQFFNLCLLLALDKEYTNVSSQKLLESLNQDLSILLKEKYHRFWSQVSLCPSSRC